jgi:hypothetical protein
MTIFLQEAPKSINMFTKIYSHSQLSQGVLLQISFAGCKLNCKLNLTTFHGTVIMTRQKTTSRGSLQSETFAKLHKTSIHVIPAKAGIQYYQALPGFRFSPVKRGLNRAPE